MMQTLLNPNRCPLCGRSNQCAVSAGSPAQDCWCMTAAISGQALAQLSDELRDKACICPACAANAAPAAQPYPIA